MRHASLVVGALVGFLASVPAVAWAQNSPPKPESDCGVTSMCSPDSTVVPHGHVASWIVALVLFAIVIVVLGAAYRFVTIPGSRRRAP